MRYSKKEKNKYLNDTINIQYVCTINTLFIQGGKKMSHRYTKRKRKRKRKKKIV